MKIKGFLHIHSNFSDGELSLKEIKERAKKMKGSFVFLSDHLEFFDSSQKMKRFLEECEKLSEDDFLMIPGFEISPKNNFHILLYNINRPIPCALTVDNLKDFHVKENELLILAHGSSYFKKPLPEFLKRKIHGVEVWNARYDSLLAPNLNSFKYLDDSKIPLIGLDAHNALSFKNFYVQMEVEELKINYIIENLKKRNFKVGTRYMILDFKNLSFSFFQKFCFKIVNFSFFFLRGFLSFFGSKISYPLKLKRFFHKIF